jgi:hypothetical protein
LQIRAQQAILSYLFIWILNLVCLHTVFLVTWSNFDIIITIWILEVLSSKTTIVITSWDNKILGFLNFPNEGNAFDTFFNTFSCAFTCLAFQKPNIVVSCLNFVCFIPPCSIWDSVITLFFSKNIFIMLLTCSLTSRSELESLNSSLVFASKLSKMFPPCWKLLQSPSILET